MSDKNCESEIEAEVESKIESEVERKIESEEPKLEIEKDKKYYQQKEKIVDGIIKAFTVKRRKALIDLEDRDNVDYETSEKRLIYLASILALLFGTSSTVLSSILAHQWFNSERVIIRYPMIPKESASHLFPHLALLFNDGLIEIFEFSSGNDNLKHSWTFKVPAQKNEVGYIILIHQGSIIISYSEGQKDTTIIESNQNHHTIPHSKIPKNLYYNPRYVQVKNQVWMFGGLTDIIKVPLGKYSGEDCQLNVTMPEKMTRQSLIWNLERQVYYPGPMLPNKELGRGCPVLLNRTDVLLLYIDDKTYCLQAWVFSFEHFQWSHLSSCIYQPPTKSASLHFDLLCTSLVDKLGKLMILAVLDGKDYSFDECITHVLDIVHLDFNTQVVSRISHNFTYTSNYLTFTN